MMNKNLLSILLLCFAAAVHAEIEDSATTPTQTPGVVRFISDELTVMLRTGPSNNHKILKTLPSGTRVEGFEIQEDYQRVRAQNGLEGWVLKQYLTEKPIARQALSVANEKLGQLEAKNKQLQMELQQLRENYSKLKEEFRILDKAKGETEDELNRIRDIAAQPLQISAERDKLSEQAQTLEGQVDTLRAELQGLRDDTHKQWFLTGAAVVLLGILIGLLIPKFRRHRHTDWR